MTNTKYIIPSLHQACRVLLLFAQKKRPLSLREVHELLNLPRTTTMRILETLSMHGLLNKREKNTYALGATLAHLGEAFLATLDIRTVARPVLTQLTGETQETSQLAVFSNDQSLLIEVCDSPKPFRMAARPGTMLPLYCTATGKVFLAYSVKNLQDYLQHVTLRRQTQRTLTQYECLVREITRIRETGYAIDNEEFAEGVRCLAAPVYDVGGNVTAAIGITASATTFLPEHTPEMADAVIRAASRLSALLGQREIFSRASQT